MCLPLAYCSSAAHVTLLELKYTLVLVAEHMTVSVLSSVSL